MREGLRKSKKLLLVLALAGLCLLSGCTWQTEASETRTASPSPSPTAPPTPSPTPAPTSWVVTDESAEEILALGEIGTLREIDATASREYEALLTLCQMLPECDIRWVYPFGGEMIPSDTEELTVTDTEGLDQALRYLPDLRKVDMLACTLTTEEMENYSQLRPDIDFLWMVRFGKWEVRSDITIFSTLSTDIGHPYRYVDEEMYPLLRFCHKLRALDLGHNDLCDLTLIGELSELQVLILVDNQRVTDISPLANLKNLRYLELFTDENIRDFSPLEGLTAMEDLNLSWCKYLDNIDFIANMPNFQNGWFRFTGVDREDVEQFSGRDICFTYDHNREEVSSTAWGWRSTERNIAIRKAFSKWREIEEYISWDNIIYTDTQ